ncbi:hypothetical protein [Myxococcus qinghaiensis]|uniref:hypothetical protein n=1 Tax=Myxococcus qinghaiensis TaxID=2906758 RepID=UPI0020A81E2F|nr:hypothetical protein [Myxococcus qinghaiensis]MCP3166940.1 hypothetical protein [Myxococcus qinghaiensis]
MRTMRGVWLALALAMSGLQSGCGDGLTPGSEDSDGDGVVDTVDCAPFNRAYSRKVSAFTDVDGDGWGEGDSSEVCGSSEALPPGWAFMAGDCAPRDNTRWLTLSNVYQDLDSDGATGQSPMEACVGATHWGYRGQAGPKDCDDADARYQDTRDGWPDLDGDGVGEGARVDVCAGKPPPPGFAIVSGDCAPLDATRAVAHAYLYRDEDGDGLTVDAPGTLCLAPSQPLPRGYTLQSGGTDCDDLDATVWWTRDVYVDSDHDGYGTGEPQARCVGELAPRGYALQGEDCAPADAFLWQWRSYAYRDADGDGDTVPEQGVRCSGELLPQGYAVLPRGLDCDDQDATVRVSWSVHPDEDGDQVGAGPAVTMCAGGTVPAGYSTFGNDCAPSDASGWQLREYRHRDADGDGYTVPESGEVCGGTSLPPGYAWTEQRRDCDDTSSTRHTSLLSWRDLDGDGVGAGASETLCTDGQVPASWSTVGTDCADDDATRWIGRNYTHVDRDLDGATTPERGGICSGSTLPSPYFTKATGNDCDDADPERTRWLVLYPDLDGDGVGAEPRQIPCLGAALPPGMSIYGYDVDDHDPEVTKSMEDDLHVELILEL